MPVNYLYSIGSWQHQAERIYQKAPHASVSGHNNIDKKRILRLDERKLKEIQKKKAHKMMRQISDESSDEDGTQERRKVWIN